MGFFVVFVWFWLVGFCSGFLFGWFFCLLGFVLLLLCLFRVFLFSSFYSFKPLLQCKLKLKMINTQKSAVDNSGLLQVLKTAL